MFTSDIPLSLSTLTLLKWTDANGHQHNFRLINITSSRWREFGYRFRREENELENLREECFGKANRCWCKVMNQWLENGGTPEYPATWRGVLTVLVDLEYSEVARELQRALASVTPPPSPPPPQMAQPAVTPPIELAVIPPPDPAVSPLQLVMALPPEPAVTPPPAMIARPCQLAVTLPLKLTMNPSLGPAVTEPPEAAVTEPPEAAVTLSPEPAMTPPPEESILTKATHHIFSFSSKIIVMQEWLCGLPISNGTNQGHIQEF